MDKLADLLGSLKDHFNDFLGAVIPGTILCAGVIALWQDRLQLDLLNRLWGDWKWLPALAAIFAVGHILLALHASIREWLHKRTWFHKLFPNRLTPLQQSKDDPIFLTFKDVITPRLEALGISDLKDFSALRNIAMTMSISAADLGRRFMFIALFCYGTMIACMVLGLAVIVSPFRNVWPMPTFGIVVTLLVAGVLLNSRGRAFEKRALMVPFPIAAAALLMMSFTVCAEGRK